MPRVYQRPYHLMNESEIAELEAYLEKLDASYAAADAFDEEQRAKALSNEASDDDWYQEIRAWRP